jgi:hypothetical protein
MVSLGKVAVGHMLQNLRIGAICICCSDEALGCELKVKLKNLLLVSRRLIGVDLPYRLFASPRGTLPRYSAGVGNDA